MPKNIVICCDGTGNEFGRSNSNVVKLYKVLARSESQIMYYHPGVGTMGSRNALSRVGKLWTRLEAVDSSHRTGFRLWHLRQRRGRILVFDANISARRAYLCFWLQPRGIHSPRALRHASLRGLIDTGQRGSYSLCNPNAQKQASRLSAEFKKTFSRDCKVRFAGVWDTVSSVGWVYDAVRFPFTKATNNPDMRVIRHAVSIDESRAFFRQNLFGEPHGTNQDVQEVWFAGVHSDVGGSYPESESQLSKLALRWMVCEAELAGFQVDQQRKADILGGNPPYVQPDAVTPNQHESLRVGWWIAELWPNIVHKKTGRGTWGKSIRVNLGRRRWMAPDSVVHESVETRFGSLALNYKPANLPLQRTTANDRCSDTGSVAN